MKVFKLCQLILVLFSTSAMQPSDYIRLISNVKDHFATSSVFLLHRISNGLLEFREYYQLIRLLSMKGVLVVDMDLARFEKNLQFHRTRILRPLIVVILRYDDHVSAFSNFTRHFQMDYSIWLLIFASDVDSKNTMIPRNENIFHLRFDTELLVFRTGSKIIEEWYSLHNETRTAEFAGWDAESGLILRSNGTLYQRRANLENTTIVVATVDTPSATVDPHKAIGALFRKIITELGIFLNFNIKTVSLVEKIARVGNGESREPYTPTTMIETLQTGEVDITSAELVVNAARMKLIDFTYPLISTRVKLYIKEPETGIRWSGYFEIFTSKIWMAIGVTVLLTAGLLTVAVAIKDDEMGPNSFAGNIFLVVAIYCQQGVIEPPGSWPLKLACFSALISALVVCAAYSASLISHLTVGSPQPPFLSLEGFLADGTYKLIVFPDSAEYDMLANATDHTLIRMFFLIRPTIELPKTIDDAFRQVCEERVAFLNQEARMRAAWKVLPCKMIGIGAQHVTNFAIATPKRNPFHGVIDHYIKRLLYGGIVDRYKRRHRPIIDPPIPTFYEVSISAVTPTFVILSVGILLAIVVLFLELFTSVKYESIPARNRTCISSEITELEPRLTKNHRSRPKSSLAKYNRH